MQYKKKIMVVGLLLLTMLGTSGCIVGDYLERRYMENSEYKTEKMLEYLEEKYGEPFELRVAGTSTFRSSFYGILANPISNPDIAIEVHYPDPDSFITTIQDSYMSVLMHEELEEEVTKTLEGVLDEYKVYQSVSRATLPDEIRPGIRAEDYLKTPKNFSRFSIVTSKSIENRGADLQKVYERLREKELQINFHLIFIEEEAFAKLGEHDYDTTMIPKEGFTNALISCYIEEDWSLTNTGWRYNE